MKKTLLFFLTAIMLVGCYDDSKLWDAVDNNTERIAELETLYKQLNTNISSLQTIVTALQNNDYVTYVAPIQENGKEIGYTIVFSKSGIVTIYHGKDGKDGADGANGEDGSTPVIGVRQDTDGVWYWTLNGDWLLDDTGKKIPTTGKDGKDGQDGAAGKDGITPQLKIEEGYWYLSYDNGSTWQKLGKATGDNGLNGEDGDAFFQNVTEQDNTVIFTLADGTIITIPKIDNEKEQFSIVIAEDSVFVWAGEKYILRYTLRGTSGKTAIATICENGWSALVDEATDSTGVIEIMAPELLKDGKIIVIATNSGTTALKELTLRLKRLEVESTRLWINSEAGSHTIELNTNIPYEIEIPSESQNWISVGEQLTDTNFVLNISENFSLNPRSAICYLKGMDGVIADSVSIYQEQIPIDNIVLSSNKTVIQSDGVDSAELNVIIVSNGIYLDAKDLFPDEIDYYNYDGKYLDIDDFMFSVTDPGDYPIWCRIGVGSSNEIVIRAYDVEIPESPADPYPNRTDFRPRVLFTLFNGLNSYDYLMIDKIDPMIQDEEFGDNLIWVACHSMLTNDLAYIPSSYCADACRVSGYPAVNMDFKETTNNYKLSTEVYKEKVSGYLASKEGIACGISVNASMVSNQVVAKVTVKSAQSGEYRVSGLLLEDGISQNQPNLGVIDHDACIRYIDSGTASGNAKILGHKLGQIAAGATVDYLFIWNLDEIETEYLNAGYWGGKGLNYDNLRLAFYVTTADANGTYYVSNVIESPLNGETPFCYKN